MPELHDIVAAFEALAAEGKPSALATVVAVDGSAYRRPGARMLVAEDGRTWGGVSGGCLERDVADRARGVIAAGRPHLQRYDTTDEELIARGVSTGCGGTIDVLIQPLAPGDPLINLLARVLRDRRPLAIAIDICPLSPAFAATTVAGPFDVATPGRCFVETLRPSPRLVLIGGGPDVVPVVVIAKTLGWHVAVVAARPAVHVHTRFATADERYVTGADAPLHGVPIAAEDAVVVMTHNLARDAAVLTALPVRPRYLGLLGPRHRTERAILALPPGHPGRALHSPVGLDIGSETPEEIALSIVAEVQAVLRRGDARPLSAKPTLVDVACPA